MLALHSRPEALGLQAVGAAVSMGAVARTLLLPLLVGCGGVETEETVAASSRHEARSVPAACVVSLDSASGEARVGESLVREVSVQTLRAALGDPDRIETTESAERFEEYGFDDVEPTSMMVRVVWQHAVYDARSLTLESPDGSPVPGVTRMRVFFEHERAFDNRRPPAVVPRTRGGCTLQIDGAPVDTAGDLVPEGTDHRTGTVELNGAIFGVTSFAGDVDSLYLDSPGFRVTIYLDDAATQRAAYAEVVLVRSE